MLQQTQVSRVAQKYTPFLSQFPDVKSLAQAPLADVIIAWSGLGYNRRAKYLHEASKQLAELSRDWTLEDLTACRGIGYNTAAAVLVYAYNLPLPFIETNVRTVLIHHLFSEADSVDDKQLMEALKQVFDNEHPREFMWAMMDYGTHLKTTIGNLNRLSKHYTKQSRFEGSKRQIRGEVLRFLAPGPQPTSVVLAHVADERTPLVLEELTRDGLVKVQGNQIMLAT